MASKFSVLFLTDSEAHNGYMGFLGIKRPGRGADNLPLLSLVLKKYCNFFQRLSSVRVVVEK